MDADLAIWVFLGECVAALAIWLYLRHLCAKRQKAIDELDAKLKELITPTLLYPVGTTILCANKHIVGTVNKDIHSDQPIMSANIDFMPYNRPNPGDYICCKVCGGDIVKQEAFGWRFVNAVIPNGDFAYVPAEKMPD